MSRMTAALGQLSALLGGGAGIGVPPGRIGAVRPASAADLPSVSVSIVVDANRRPFVARQVREIEGRIDAADIMHGVLQLEMWGTGAAAAADAAARVEQRLADRRELRSRGFLLMTPVRLETLEEVRRERAVGSPFAAWLQRMEYRFAFEELTSEADSTGVITQIDVALDGQLAEALVVR